MIYDPATAAYYQTKGHAAIRSVVQKALEPVSLNVTEWRSLSQVAEAGEKGLRLSEVAKHVGVEAPLLTLIARKLHTQGWLTWKHDKNDKRARRYVATQEGYEFLRSISHDIESGLGMLFSGVSKEEMEVYFGVLKKVIAQAE